jgi:hypothetical protein
MDKQKAIELAGSAKALADIFGITESAVSQWGDEIPELRVLQLEKLRPDWFQKKPAPKTHKFKNDETSAVDVGAA